MTAAAAKLAPKVVVPFPRVFWVAIGLEVLERLAFYGVYINLGVYLTQPVGLSDQENGALLGLFALVRAWLPVGTGALADRLGFRRSLLLSFAFYIVAYAALFAFPSRAGAWSAVFGMAFAGAFLKPVIPGTVRRYAPKGRETQGFSIFYASVNAGSVVGKIATKIVRTLVSLRQHGELGARVPRGPRRRVFRVLRAEREARERCARRRSRAPTARSRRAAGSRARSAPDAACAFPR